MRKKDILARYYAPNLAVKVVPGKNHKCDDTFGSYSVVRICA